jgi:hypothetical protein
MGGNCEVEIIEVLKTFAESYGPAALPWSVVAFLGWTVLKERAQKDAPAVSAEYKEIIERYENLLEKVLGGLHGITIATERMALLIEERTRRQNNRDDH